MSSSAGYYTLTDENKHIVCEMIDRLLKIQLTEEKKVPRTYLTDDQVEIEIARLKASEYVKLGKAEERIRMRRRQYMYKLRDLEKKGKALAAAGLTLDMLNESEE